MSEVWTCGGRRNVIFYSAKNCSPFVKKASGAKERFMWLVLQLPSPKEKPYEEGAGEDQC